MQSINELLELLQATSLAVFIHKTPWALTTIAVVHAFAVSLMLVMIATVDLRRLSLALTKRPFAELSRQVLPSTWAAFILATITGLIMFASRATEYFVNTLFWLKMALIVLAGINLILFTSRNAQKWDLHPTLSTARLAGGISIICWVLATALGRWIAFTLLPE